MVILSKTVIKLYQHLLKLTQNKESQQMDHHLSTKKYALPVEARYWGGITEVHYGCDDIVNGSGLRQLIYARVAKMMNNAEEMANSANRDIAIQASRLLTASLVINPNYMFDKKDFFKHKGKIVIPLSRKALIKKLHQKISNFNKCKELSL